MAQLVESIVVRDRADLLGPGAMAITHSLKTKAPNCQAVVIEETGHLNGRWTAKFLQVDKQRLIRPGNLAVVADYSTVASQEDDNFNGTD